MSVFRDLFSDPDPYEDDPPYEITDRRPMLIVAGVIGGLVLIGLICLVAYAVFIVPGNREARQTEVAQVETENASAVQTLAAGAMSPTPEPSRTSAPTRTPAEAATTEEGTLTVTPTEEASTETPTPTATGEPTGTSTPPPEPTTEPEIILEDEFAGSGSGWSSTEQENYSFGYSGGAYRFFVDLFNADIWSVRGEGYEDVRVEVDVEQIAGPEESYYGLICRFQDGANYYAFVVHGAGQARIFVKAGGVSTDLGEADELPGTGGDRRLRADCIDDELTLYVDGREAVQAQDDTFAAGAVGVLAGTGQTPGLEMAFDNFLLAQP